MQKLDFSSLNRDANAETWCDTFAYWLLILHDPSSIYARNADEAQSIMSYQYDVEDQGNLEGEGPDGKLFPNVFMPIAPVTLALRWSPFPAAMQNLGQPLHLDKHQGDALAVFAPQLVDEATASTPDEKHFNFLLRHACARAAAEKALVLLVGSPGWSYDSEDYLESEPEIRQLMHETGFIYTLRKPT
ncbi:hypothetical protein GCM10023172_07870 [Hymenobacter ginsengisoli]|uniref:Uncharacterized protein n=1 Tax=Hymenobacter ginsengisoli TaxID=1051626 RepID=A0ABP8Q0H4_9BACT|nr:MULTISPECIES: hypothetical protein [unclassified Hymenobacter]